MLATRTGFRVWNMSESGTGYVQPGGKGYPGFEPSPYGSAKRLAAILDAPLDALLIGGSINDGYKAVELQRPAVDALLSQLEEARPDLPVVLLGVEPLVAYHSSYWMSRGKTFTSNLRSMVGRHQNVVGFIDPFTSPWLTGNGSTAKPTGNGNSDEYVGSDGVHLSAAGARYYQDRIVDELRKLPLPATADGG
jgi:lysophospholipase L1-like esterase